jgi:hypothetical protein
MLQPEYAILKKWANGTTNPSDVIIPPVTISNTVANQEIGYPPSQEQDPVTGGQYIKRAEMNGVFKLYSEHIEFINKGGSYTFNTDIANAGGYSTGATLWSDYYSRFVTSLKDNNTDNFITDVNKIDGVSWQFSELSEYINIPEIPLNIGGIAGDEVVIFCSKKKYLKHTVNSVVKFSFMTGTGNINTFMLRVEGNPLINNNELQEYQTSILSNFNNIGAKLEINTYGAYLGALETKPADYIIVTIKIILPSSEYTKWASPFKLIDLSIESINTIVPVIGHTLNKANQYLGTANVPQNALPRLLYLPSITDTGLEVSVTSNKLNITNTQTIINSNTINLQAPNILFNNNWLHHANLIYHEGRPIVIDITKLLFTQNPSQSDKVYKITLTGSTQLNIDQSEKYINLYHLENYHLKFNQLNLARIDGVASLYESQIVTGGAGSQLSQYSLYCEVNYNGGRNNYLYINKSIMSGIRANFVYFTVTFFANEVIID